MKDDPDITWQSTFPESEPGTDGQQPGRPARSGVGDTPTATASSRVACRDPADDTAPEGRATVSEPVEARS